ncbi:MAG: glycosyltransferase [Vulcanimicrobiaceae bacterium]
MPATKTARVAVCGHVTEVAGPVQAIERYLRLRQETLSFAKHPFGYTKRSESQYERWTAQTLVARATFRAPRYLSVARDVFANLTWFGLGPQTDVFIGIDNVNAFCGLILRILGKTKNVVYYVIDYTPRRFRNRFLNWLYHETDRFVVKHADVVWNISERIAAVRRQQGIDDTKNRVVEIGIDFRNIRRTGDRNRFQIVIASHLTEGKGVQLAIAAMPSILSRVPKAELLIFGTGPYEDDLKDLVSKANLSRVVRFGGLLSHDELMEALPKSGVALAPYVDDPESITYYADPTKPKEYLACGLPVVITKVPWIAGPIGESPMGIAIEYDPQALADAVVRLLDDERFYETCVVNGLNFVEGLAWTTIYDRAMNSLP